jgi:hypothetical protein
MHYSFGPFHILSISKLPLDQWDHVWNTYYIPYKSIDDFEK